MKSSAVRINSQVSNNMAQIMQKAQNYYRGFKSTLPSSVNFLKTGSYKMLNVLLVIKLFHFYVIALAQGGNNSNFLLLYTLRCF